MGLARKGRWAHGQSDLEIPPSQNAQEAPRRHYHYVLRIEIVAEGAVIKHDLIEGLRRHGDNPAAVVPGVPMLRDDRLPHRDALLTSLGLLRMEQRKRREKKQKRGQKTEEIFI